VLAYALLLGAAQVGATAEPDPFASVRFLLGEWRAVYGREAL